MSKIKIMKEVLANKIAAGEVIERPLSVVKELVENSLDAGSSAITISLVDSGIKKIEIKDNGSGMNETDLPLAIKRHATSKLYDDKDMFKISTLGFRGEALPSIFAVSQMSIASSTDGIGGKILKKIDDENYQIENIAINKGTIITIENLFYNTPVRYKHLSNTFYELSLIVQYINKLSLIHNDVSFKLINNDNELIQTSGDRFVKNILANHYNYKLASNMQHIKCKNDHFKVEMYVSHPHDTRSRKTHITIGLNKRLIRNYQIENKIIESYGTFLHTGQYPIAYIDIEVNYSLIDVNVHPTKQQVKISLIDSLLDLISEHIKMTLGGLLYVAEPEDVKVNNYLNTACDDKQEVEANLDMLFSDKKVNENSELEHEKINIINDQNSISDENEVFTYNQTNIDKSEQLFSLEANEQKQSLGNKLPIFNFIGTLHNTYLLFENVEGLYLVDQHAAQERINYEIIYDSFKNKKFNYQQSLLPIVISLDSASASILNDNTDLAKNFGFKLENFGIDTFKVVEIDNWIASRPSPEEDVKDMINVIIDKKNSSFEQYYDEVAISMACKKSIKAHQRLNKIEAEALIRDLNLTRQPYTCPHGRPVLVKLTTKEIEKMFKRIF